MPGLGFAVAWLNPCSRCLRSTLWRKIERRTLDTSCPIQVAAGTFGSRAQVGPAVTPTLRGKQLSEPRISFGKAVAAKCESTGAMAEFEIRTPSRQATIRTRRKVRTVVEVQGPEIGLSGFVEFASAMSSGRIVAVKSRGVVYDVVA
jgi:hypothetical protein